jgi:hypothetical protein
MILTVYVGGFLARASSCVEKILTRRGYFVGIQWQHWCCAILRILLKIRAWIINLSTAAPPYARPVLRTPYPVVVVVWGLKAKVQMGRSILLA